MVCCSGVLLVQGSKFNADDNNNDNLDDGRWLKKNKCCEGMQEIWGRIVNFAKHILCAGFNRHVLE